MRPRNLIRPDQHNYRRPFAVPAPHGRDCGRVFRWLRAPFMAVVLAASSLASAQDREDIKVAASHLEISAREIADAYIDVAFGIPGSDAAPRDTLLRRNSEARVAVVPWLLPSGLENLPAAERLYDRLGEIVDDINSHAEKPTALDLLSPAEVTAFLSEPVSTERSANSVLFYIGSRPDIQSTVQRYGAQFPWISEPYDRFVKSPDSAARQFCGTYVTQNPAAPAEAGFALVFMEFGTDFDQCLYRLLLQSFGLLYGAKQDDSIFSPDAARRNPSDLDWLIWRIHTGDVTTVGADRDKTSSTIVEVLR